MNELISNAYNSAKKNAFGKVARYSNHDANTLRNAMARLNTIIWQYRKLQQDTRNMLDNVSNILCNC